MTITTKQLPAKGETVIGGEFITYPGGKGANQAVAAARLGSAVKLIGAVGDDVFGTSLLNGLQGEGINLDGVRVKAGCSTGVANIILSEHDNRIIVAPGANTYVTPKLIDQNIEAITTSDVILMQLEIPIETVEYVTNIAVKEKIPVILNPAPYQKLSANLLNNLTYITPNALEARELKLDTDCLEIDDKLIVTKGSEGVEYKGRCYPASVVEVKDTTGAGDTFNGALAAFISKGIPLSEAIPKANIAAAISVTKEGAQTGMPSLAEVLNFNTEVH